MGYRDVLVHVPLVGSEHQMGFALALAKQFDAHLTGICILPDAAMLRSAVQDPLIRLNKSEVFDIIQREYDEAAATERKFNAAVEKAGVSHSWLTGEGNPADILVHASRLQDLAIVEQSRVANDLLWGPAIQLALSGRPTLILPIKEASAALPKRILVAWNGSAQAAAAVRNALPLICEAEKVTMLVGESREFLPAWMRLPALDINGYLERHGAKTSVKNLEAPDAEAGEAILQEAQNNNVDLIVMGAFGRSRLREWVLGGATRHVLEHMTLPIFMTH